MYVAGGHVRRRQANEDKKRRGCERLAKAQWGGRSHVGAEYSPRWGGGDACTEAELRTMSSEDKAIWRRNPARKSGGGGTEIIEEAKK